MTRPKVLLVDDSALVRAVVGHALAADYEVASIDDPRGLAAEVARFSPHLLLVDASYPGITDDALVSLVAAHASLPVVLFSDRAETEVRGLVTRIGARGFVPKDGATLAKRLSAFL